MIRRVGRRCVVWPEELPAGDRGIVGWVDPHARGRNLDLGLLRVREVRQEKRNSFRSHADDPRYGVRGLDLDPCEAASAAVPSESQFCLVACETEVLVTVGRELFGRK